VIGADSRATTDESRLFTDHRLLHSNISERHDGSSRKFEKSILISENDYSARDSGLALDNSNLRSARKRRPRGADPDLVIYDENLMNSSYERNYNLDRSRTKSRDMDYAGIEDLEGTVFIDQGLPDKTDLNTSQEKLDCIREKCRSQKKELKSTMYELNKIEQDYEIQNTSRFGPDVSDPNMIQRETSRLKHLIEKTKQFYYEEKSKNDKELLGSDFSNGQSSFNNTEADLLKKIEMTEKMVQGYDSDETISMTDKQ
jgi:hypothetical protein